ncbi:MAG: transglycosylase [Rhodospirillaceae bacterium]|nr:transglycosylase [Rhodospirillaceae bacterium]
MIKRLGKISGVAALCALPSSVAANTVVHKDFYKQPIKNADKPLIKADIAKYKRIFLLQKKGNWKQADRQIAKLSNPILLGHVKAQRYLHPTKYRSKYRELFSWLKLYRDHPDAIRIYKLALKRKPRNANRPQSPLFGKKKSIETKQKKYGTYFRFKSAGVRVTRKTRAFHRKVRYLVYRQRLTAAENYIKRAETRGMHKAHIDLARARISAGWFYYGNDKKTLEIALKATQRNGPIVPSAHWYAGLAAFRSKNYALASKNFEVLTSTNGISENTKRAAAFWAGRSNLIAKRPSYMSRYLLIAADGGRDFYSILARRLLGIREKTIWESDSTSYQHNFSLLTQEKVTERVLALVQVGQRSRAENDFRQLVSSASLPRKKALISAAEVLLMPGLALHAARNTVDNDSPEILRGLYPLPPWVPDGGFTLDRALIYAFMRQESAFRVNAKSRAGARGLMQLMPGTASYISGRRYMGSRKNKLFDPILNISLAQKYLRYLLKHDAVSGNLLLLAAAYNGGPGNLIKWKRRIGKNNDPLLFIESLPSKETRNFIEKVLSNLWLYRDRLGQKVPSLEALARGEVPMNVNLDSKQ